MTLSAMVLAAAAFRLLPHPSNFTPVGAMALFAGTAFADRRIALLIPIAAMVLSDLLLGFSIVTPFVYGSIALATVIGFWIRRRRSVATVLGGAVASAILFFIITNFAVWALFDYYPKTAAGLVVCYVAAIPFFQNTLAGDLFFFRGSLWRTLVRGNAFFVDEGNPCSGSGMKKERTSIFSLNAALGALLLSWAGVLAGPYSAALDDPSNPYDAPVPGFVGPYGEGKARLLQSGDSYMHPDNYVNPLFFGWAAGVADYSPASGVAGMWTDPSNALGPVTGDNFDIVSLGDLASPPSGVPGSITLTFDNPIQNKHGADFVVFENGFISAGGAGVAGQIFGELAYVEVSSDGVNFARMPSRSLTPALVGAYGTVDASNVFGLAGKHVNAYGDSWGTPFDLSWLADHPLVAGGQVNLDAITHIRIVDIPGDGFFKDTEGSPIYDAWVTIGSGGHDLEAVGVISHDMDFETWQDQRGLVGSQRGELADPDADGLPNLLEYAAGFPPLSPDAPSAIQRVSLTGEGLSLTCRRDERAVDLILEVETSPDLQNWEVIARSIGGAPFQQVFPHAPQVSETGAHHIASIGVLREVTVTDVVSGFDRRFMRLRVQKVP